MKRLIFALLTMLTIAGAMAQNANRSGFFIEAGIGGTTGTTPRVAIIHENGEVLAKFAGGPAFDFLLGYRIKTSSHWAFDVRIGGMASFNGITSPVFRAMPGMRYTSNELFGNVSLYCTMAVGFGFGFRNTLYNVILPENGEYKFKVDGDLTFGVPYMLAVGLNITNHFYVGAVWDSQYIINTIRTNRSGENLHWGMAGLQLGYRF